MSAEATALLQLLARESSQGYGLGSMSCSIYDTAWVSCVSKRSGAGQRQWLFPSSFRFILESQHEDGGWYWPPQSAYKCVEDTVLSSLAALFTITQHIKHPYQLVRMHDETGHRLRRGIAYLAEELRRLGRSPVYSVGFEMLVPALLELLEEEGIMFQFPSRPNLFRRRAVKLSKVPLKDLDRIPSTILHSLEALCGDTNFSFDSLRNRLVYGSMMASPSATAAYLMRCEKWDDSAEAYLGLALSNGSGQGSGGVPSAFPSTNFELIWVCLLRPASENHTANHWRNKVASTLLKADCVGSDAFAANDNQLLTIFQQQIQENGLVGFGRLQAPAFTRNADQRFVAPGVQPDVDDSANASIILSLLGLPGLSRQLREHFETDTHFETYRSESLQSLSANCNILLALLLDIQNQPEATTAIVKVAYYLATKWFEAYGPIQDKWVSSGSVKYDHVYDTHCPVQNVSEYYSTMLLSQAFMKMIRCWEGGNLASLSEELLHDRIILIAFRSLLRILITQQSNGCWGSRGSHEETAYAILALVELSSLPMALYFEQQIDSALLHAREYLETPIQGKKSEYLWVEKVLYGAHNISQAYVLAALNAPKRPLMESHRINRLVNIDYKGMTKFADLLQKTPLLSSQPRWLIVASWIEGHLFLPMLEEVRRAVFTRAGMTKDRYLTWIPVMWTLANNTSGCHLSARLLFDMMRVSVLNFQADEFMETVLDTSSDDDGCTVRDTIEDLFKNIDMGSGMEIPSSSAQSFNPCAASTNSTTPTQTARVGQIGSPSTANTQSSSFSSEPSIPPIKPSISQSLELFIRYITKLTATANVPTSIVPQIRAELKAFLDAHLTQTQLNRDFSARKAAIDIPPTACFAYRSPSAPSFRSWLHNTAAVHTSCPYSFTLYLALVSASPGHSGPLLRSSRQRFVAADLCGHLARMCRLYNDHGSLERDLAEGNLNCANFPDFQEGETDDDDCGQTVVSTDSEVSGTMEGGSAKSGASNDQERMKRRLMQLAQWERKGLERAMEELDRCSGADANLRGALRVFVDVTDLFGQVYTVKDLASRRM